MQRKRKGPRITSGGAPSAIRANEEGSHDHLNQSQTYMKENIVQTHQVQQLDVSYVMEPLTNH